MNNCLTQSDLEQLGSSMIIDFERRIASIPEHLCGPFHQEARQLETELIAIYKVVALCARKEQDLARVAEGWKLMVKMCDDAALQLSQLTAKHPGCGAETYYDRVLDLRNKCHRLQQMHS